MLTLILGCKTSLNCANHVILNPASNNHDAKLYRTDTYLTGAWQSNFPTELPLLRQLVWFS